MSVDGKIALPSRKQTRISNEKDLKRVHLLRNECDAVLVGIGTVLADDPKLVVKKKYVPHPSPPLRIVLDSTYRTPKNAEILNYGFPTLIVTTVAKEINGTTEVIKCGRPGERINLKKLMRILTERGIKKLLVEGGEQIIWAFFKEGLVDELLVFIAPMIIGGSTSPTLAGDKGASSLDTIIKLKLRKMRKLGEGILLNFEV